MTNYIGPFIVMAGEGRPSTSRCGGTKTWMAGTSQAMTNWCTVAIPKLDVH